MVVTVPVFPVIERLRSGPFLERLQRSGKKWVVAVDGAGEPVLVIDSDGFVRDVLFGKAPFCPNSHCHRPVIIRERGVTLGDVITRLKVHPQYHSDDVIDDDIILYWAATGRRVITGADILGRLLRGIVQQDNVSYTKLTSACPKTKDE